VPDEGSLAPPLKKTVILVAACPETQRKLSAVGKSWPLAVMQKPHNYGV